MKNLNLNIDLSDLAVNEEDKQSNPIKISTTVIKNVILSVAQSNKGFSEEDRRIYYKLCDAFEVAVKDNTGTLSIDDNWAEFIVKNFKEAKLVPNDLLRKVEQLVEGIK